MADVTTPAAVAAGITIGGVSAVVGVPIWTVIAAVVGATIAVSQSGRLELSVRGMWAVFTSFAVAASLGVLGGPFVAAVVVQVLAKLSITVAESSADALMAWAFALQGQAVILPAVARRLGVEIAQRGAPQ